ncbi:MAG: DNA repair protein RecN [Bacteroidota bacterium]|nr:DNA repair protein RecN [Bacteroidota bacterium]
MGVQKQDGPLRLLWNMLRSLSIRNFAIIDELEIEFEGGLNILTGETGAGKSIMIGALKMILGERASMGSVRTGARKAIIEGIFDEAEAPSLARLLHEHRIDAAPELIMRREISTRSSRAFINDTPAPLPVMREVAAQLIDLHGQHENQSLLRTETHLDLLDNFGGLHGMRDGYRRIYAILQALWAKREELVTRKDRLAAQKEQLEFEIAEIDEVDPAPEEDVLLRDEERRLENAENLFEATATLYDLLYARDDAASDQLIIARNALQDIVRIDRTLEEALEELRSAQISVSEVAATLQDYNARIEFNPDHLENVRLRLRDLERLKRKYGGSMEAVMEHRATIGRQADLVSNFEHSLKELDGEIAEVQADLSAAALRMSIKRHEVAEHLEASITVELDQLGMTSCRFAAEFTRRRDDQGWIRLTTAGKKAERYAASAKGMDEVEFLIATNPGEPAKPLARIASGGEVSRIMLALKTVLAKSDRLPILVFDEIDTGISGTTARKVGHAMADLARYHQIIAITHLPQIAALGQAHYTVEKHPKAGRTVSQIRRLTEEERLEHLARLLTGTEVTDAMRESARALLRTRSDAQDLSD